MTEIPSRAEMAEELAAILLPTEWFEDKHADGQSPHCCDAVEHITDALARRDEMVIDFVAANFEFDGDDDGIIIDKVSKAIRALKGKLR